MLDNSNTDKMYLQKESNVCLDQPVAFTLSHELYISIGVCLYTDQTFISTDSSNGVSAGRMVEYRISVCEREEIESSTEYEADATPWAMLFDVSLEGKMTVVLCIQSNDGVNQSVVRSDNSLGLRHKGNN